MRPANRMTEEMAVRSARPPASERLREEFLPAMSRLTLGVVRWDAAASAFRLGPVTLFRFGSPQARGEYWRWPIEGGLLVGSPGGWTGVGLRRGELFAYIEGYGPRLPRGLYRLTQLRVHRLLTRLFLLQQAGRVPPPGVPAAPAARIAAACADLTICAGLAALAGRGRRLGALALVTGAYHAIFWTQGGATPGDRLLGLRVVSVDGSPVSLGQALIRLAAAPLAALRLGAVHDQAAATEVVSTRS